jgi:hypothetical protein
MNIGSQAAGRGPLSLEVQLTINNFKTISQTPVTIQPLPFNAATDAQREPMQVRVRGCGSAGVWGCGGAGVLGRWGAMHAYACGMGRHGAWHAGRVG